MLYFPDCFNNGRFGCMPPRRTNQHDNRRRPGRRPRANRENPRRQELENVPQPPHVHRYERRLHRAVPQIRGASPAPTVKPPPFLEVPQRQVRQPGGGHQQNRRHSQSNRQIFETTKSEELHRSLFSENIRYVVLEFMKHRRKNTRNNRKNKRKIVLLKK